MTNKYYSRYYEVGNICKKIKGIHISDVMYYDCNNINKLSNGIDKFINKFINLIKNIKFVKIEDRNKLKYLVDKAKKCFDERIYKESYVCLNKKHFNNSIKVAMYNKNTLECCSFNIFIIFNN